MLINAETMLRGDKISLVPYRPHHVPTYHGWMASPELRELTESEPLSLEEEYAMCDSWQRDDDKLTFIIVENRCRGDGESSSSYLEDHDDVRHAVGDVNCFFNDPDDVYDNVEVEVMVAEVGARRKGYAKEALGLMMRFVIGRLGVKGFRAQILERNEQSVKLFERMGWRFVKKIACFGEVVYGIRAEEVVARYGEGGPGGWREEPYSSPHVGT